MDIPCDCAKCGARIEYNESHCQRCGEFHSFPNVRSAREEQADLKRRYDAAYASAGDDIRSKLAEIERLARESCAVLNLRVVDADNVSRDQKYRNYYQACDAKLRKIALQNHHGEREAVDVKFFPGYHHNIEFLALSPFHAGLAVYGPVVIELSDDQFLKPRASLLEANTYRIFDEHRLGARDASLPRGLRARWEDRHMLAVAKLRPAINSSSTKAEIEAGFLTSTDDRLTDEFIEVHVYSEEGIPTQYFGAVTLQTPLTDPVDRARWDLAKQGFESRGIRVLS